MSINKHNTSILKTFDYYNIFSDILVKTSNLYEQS